MSQLLYTPATFAAEHEFAARLGRLLSTAVDRVDPVTDGLKYKQPEAAALCCSQPVSILYGRPGSGKTTTIRRIVESFDAQGMKGIVACPTAKAGKRADEVINDPNLSALSSHPDCMTAHRLLKYSADKEFNVNDDKPLDIDYLIGDEWSMAGLHLANNLLSRIQPGRTRLIFVGDPYQLPSVDPGNVLYDLIKSGVVPQVELIDVLRQGKDSGIVHNAGRVLEGKPLAKIDPKTGEAFEDFFFVPREDPNITFNSIMEYVEKKIPDSRGFNNLTDIQVLSPGKKSVVGTQNLNKELAERLNPGKKRDQGIAVGDKVINRKNNLALDIVNGDVGIVKEVRQSGYLIDFGPGVGKDGSGLIEISGDNKADIHLAYCFTIHSSQGSEFPVVIIPLHKTHWMLMVRNLLYTGITRAKKLCVLLGEPLALEQCIHNNQTESRITGLQRLILKYSSRPPGWWRQN
jgi:exodeoxyribonuclease V alpha subunit